MTTKSTLTLLNFMKITKLLILFLVSSLLFNCSSSDNNEESEITDPVSFEKDLLKISGDDDHWLNYENGKINKAWSTGTTFRSQMAYNANGTMSKEYREGTGNPNFDNENFGWVVPFSEDYIENIYENERLVEVIRHDSGDSWKLVEYAYQGDLVVEKKVFYGEDNSVDRIFTYQYNNQNEITTIIWNETPSGGSSHTLQVTFDNKTNPYYKIWEDTKLIFWNAQDGPARYNLEFYPHNILKLQEEGSSDIWYEAFYTYDEDNYPTIMNITEGNQEGSNYYFEYQ